MVRIANCPECAREVAVADEALSLDEGAQLRCPLCDAEFPKDRLNFRGVPELILSTLPTAASAAAGPAESADEAAKSTDASHDPDAPASTGEAAEQPDEARDEAALDTRHEALQEAHEDPSPLDMPVIKEPVREAYEGEISTEAKGTRAQDSPSFLRQMVGVVGGGFIGLMIGYFLLLWIGGPEKDFLEIGERLPPWAVPQAFHGDTGPMLEGEPQDPSLAELLDRAAELDQDATDDVPSDEQDPPTEPFPVAPSDQAELPPVEVEVREPPVLGTDDLRSAIESAQAATEIFTDGPVDDPAGTVRDPARAYRELADLAEALTFAEPAAGLDAEHEQLEAQAERLFRRMADEEAATGLGRLAADWLDALDRRNGGLVAAGLVVGTHLGIEHQPGTIVELSGTRRNIVVVGPSAIEVPIGSRVLVVGSLVDRPRERISGYIGSAPRVVWSRLVETLNENGELEY